MSDRALWAAFQKVRTEVEGALEETRKKEAQRIEAEEKRRREEKAKKRAPQPAASAAPRRGIAVMSVFVVQEDWE